MTFYKMLEVSEDASEEVIKMAYKALAKKYHPDVYTGDKEEAEKKMQKINRAYEVLSDASSRKEYDEKLQREREIRQQQREQKSAQQEERQKSSAQTESYTSEDNSSGSSGCSGCLTWIVIIIVAMFIFNKCYDEKSPQPATDSEQNVQQTESVQQTETMQQTQQIPDTPSAKPAIEAYLSALRNCNTETALGYVSNDELSEMTTSICDIYTTSTNPDEMLYEAIQQIRKFDYAVGIPTVSGDRATVEVDMEYTNLYTIGSLALLDYQELLENDDWVAEKVIKAALTGEEVTEETIFRDTLNSYIGTGVGIQNQKVVFTMQLIDNKWKITSVEPSKEFAKAISGDITELYKILQ